MADVINNQSNDKADRKVRKRKKKLFKDIVAQLEFYFSDANLSKDIFLQKQLSENKFLSLESLKKFNKLQKILSRHEGSNEEDILRALQVIPSKMIKLTENSDGILRREPWKKKSDEEECTIYIEHIPKNADHDWLRGIFCEFGNISYVSIPKYKSGSNKGFAFVEFETTEGANCTLENYGEKGQRINANCEPSKLCSIKSFESDASGNDEISVDKKEVDNSINVQKRNINETEECDESDVKRRKLEHNAENETSNSKTSKKSKKRQQRHREDRTEIEITEQEIGSIFLQVMSKSQWRQLRNKYLNLQRQNMKAIKQELRQHKRLEQFNQFSKPNSDYGKVEKTKQCVGKVEYQKGIIVKVTLEKSVADEAEVKSIKEHTRTFCQDKVGYIDVKIGREFFFVRCTCPEMAKTLVKYESWPKMEILENNEEEQYWKQMEEDRKEKFEGKVKKKNLRGTEKILQKVENLKNRHTYFVD